MKRYVSGTNKANATSAEALPDGVFLARVERTQYRWRPQKPYYLILFFVVEPSRHAGDRFTARLHCTPKALWKLNWFLRDFGYDIELLGRDEIDDKNLVGLQGVVKITHAIVNGTSLLNLDGFAPRSQWHEFSGAVEHGDAQTEAAS
jgi:hypothetical protein